ncbi:MAG TPA: hypothetical protein VKV04_11225 [Verrucomicrobiae bacterium]|nr:hypothetical protein [Verrucomicrobiae bacterium]
MSGLAEEGEAWEALKPFLGKLRRGEVKTGEEVFNNIKPLLGKWLRGRLTEVDAWLLLRCFENIDNPETTEPPLPAVLRRKRTGLSKVRSRDSLAVLAYACEKHVRTVGNWCRAGLVPGAYRTRGGHWRVKITAATIPELLKRMRGRIRKPKNLLHSRRWNEFKKNMLPVFAKVVPLLFRLDAELRGLVPDDYPNAKSPVPTERALGMLLKLHRARGKRGTRYIDLRLAARALFLESLPITAGTLAVKMGTTRSTLFRHYPDHQVREAIRQAARSLDPGEQREADAVTDYDYIVCLTTNQKPPARPKPKMEATDSDSSGRFRHR